MPYLVMSPLEAFDFDDKGTLHYHYLLVPVKCRYLSGNPVASSDVSATHWFSYGDLCSSNKLFSKDVVELARDLLKTYILS